jgi:signal transduction histidine kinase
MLGAAEWSLAYAFYLGSSTPEAQALWARLQFVGICMIPPAWLSFALEYTGQEKWLTWRNCFLISVIPTITLLLIWFAPAPYMIHVQGISSTSPVTFLEWWFRIFVGYSHLLILIGTTLIAQMLGRNQLSLSQTVPLLIAVGVPWGLNVLHILDVLGDVEVNLTPLGFVLSGALLTWSLFRFHFLQVVPIARNKIVENMRDAVVVLDRHDRLADINPAAYRLLTNGVNRRSPHTLIAKPVSDIFQGWPTLLRALQEEETDTEIIKGDTPPRYYHLQVLPLEGESGKKSGRMIIWRDITERERSEKELEERERFLASLNQIAHDALQSTDFDEMLQRFADRFVALTGSDGCYITFWDPEEGTVPATTSGEAHASCQEMICRPEEATLTEATLTAGEPIAIPNVRETLYVNSEITDQLETRSLLGLPMIANGAKLGAVLVAYNESHEFSEDEIAQGSQAATQLALAVQKQRLLINTQRRNEELEALYQASLRLSSHLELKPMLESLLEHALELVAVGDAHIFLYDGDQLTFEAARWADQSQQKPYANPRPNGLTYSVARTGKRIVVQDARSHDLFSNTPWKGSIVGFPLKVEDQVIGVMNVASEYVNAFDRHILRVLKLLADQAAIAIRNAQLFADIQAESARRKALNAVIASTTSTGDLGELLETSLDLLLNALELNVGCLCISDQCAKRRESSVAPDGGLGCLSAQEPLLDHPLVVSDWTNVTSADPLLETLAKQNRAAEIQASVIVPIRGEEEYLGNLAVAALTSRNWSEEDIEFLETVGQQLGQAAQRLLLMERTQEQARQLQRVVDAAPEGVLLLGPDNKIIIANQVARQHLQWLNPTDETQRLTRLGERTLAHLLPAAVGQWQELEARGRTFELAAQSVEPASQREGWVLILRDVTTSRNMQERIQQQERLAAVGRLAAGIAHDFNNLLTGIIGLAELLILDEGLGPEAKADLQNIVEQGHQGAHLIRQILDFSRQSVSQKQPLSLESLLKEFGKFWSRTIPEHIDFDLEIEPGDYMIHADPSQIQQALTNLVLNARDALQAGGKLTVHLFSKRLRKEQTSPVPDMSPGEWVGLSVRDNGVGMTEEVQAHIFEPFFTTRPEVGTGLGLAQVYGIVSQHQGLIEVDSQPGQGTTVTLYLPALAQEPKSTSEKERSIEWGQGEQILVVEDEPVVLVTSRKQLLSLGYEVITATNGQEALEIYRQRGDEINLVLSDMVMPKMGAVELYQALKAENPTVKMIVTSGYPLDKDGAQMLRNGILDWLQKPFAIEALAEALSKALH